MPDIKRPEWAKNEDEETNTFSPKANPTAMTNETISNVSSGVLDVLDIFEIPFSETANHLVYDRWAEQEERMQEAKGKDRNILEILGDSVVEGAKDTKDLTFDLPLKILRGLGNPANATDWFDFGHKTPDSLIDNTDKLLFGEELHSNLSEDQKEQMRDTVKNTIGTTGAILGDVDTVAGGLGFLGDTNKGLTSRKLGNVAPIIDDADNLDEVVNILRKNDIDPFGEFGKKILDAKQQGKALSNADSLKESINTGEKAFITNGEGSPIRFSGKAGDIQKSAEENVANKLDQIINATKKSEPGEYFRQLTSSTDANLDPYISETIKIGNRKGNRLSEVFDEIGRNTAENFDELAKGTDFTKNELYQLAEFNKPISEFKGKTVPEGLQSNLEEVFKPFQDIAKRMDESPNIDFQLDSPKLFDDKFNYIPRQVTNDASKAMKEANPDFHKEFFGSPRDTDLYNKNLQDRIFKNISRSKVNELSNKGDLGIALNADGGSFEVGSYRELAEKFPEKAERNLLKNVTGGKKTNFYKPYSEQTLKQYLNEVSSTFSKEQTFQELMEVGKARDGIKPLEAGKDVSEGYTKLDKDMVGDLAPMFEDVQVKKDLADEISGINKQINSNHWEGLMGVPGDLTNNFKKLAIGTSPSYQGRNWIGNELRGYTDPTRNIEDYIRGQMYGYSNKISETKLGEKLNLEEILGLNDDIKLPTGETTTPRQLFEESIEQGNVSSGFRRNVLDESHNESLKDVLNKAYARNQTGQNPVGNMIQTAWDTQNKAVDGLSSIGLKTREMVTEEPSRTGDYIASRLAGYLPDSAQSRQYKNMIDYGDFGDNASNVQTLFPFMKYQAKAKPLLIQRLLQNPGKFKYGAKFKNYMEHQGDNTPESVNEQMGENPPPKYQKSPVFLGENDAGNTEYLDLNEVYGDVLGYTPSPSNLTSDDPISDSASQVSREIVSAMHPGLSTAFTLATNTDNLGRDIGEIDFIGDIPMNSKGANVLKTMYPTLNYIDPLFDDKASTGQKINDLFNPINTGTSYRSNENIEGAKDLKGFMDSVKYDLQDISKDEGKRENLEEYIQDKFEIEFNLPNQNEDEEEKTGNLKMPDW